MNPLPIIAIVGRPNVGKSTLFNRLIGKRYAVVAKEAGTTRDRITQKFKLHGNEILLVDTGGVQHGELENIEAKVQLQAKHAIEEADLILFVVDISQELTADDFSAADTLRKSKKPIILAANKSDNKSLEENVYNFYELGFGDPMQISAIHTMGIEKLKDKIFSTLKVFAPRTSLTTSPAFGGVSEIEIKNDSANPNICILGKPNVGKSSLVNALLGSEKVIVSEIPGTTRDIVDIEITYNDKTYNLIDTAGLKKPGQIKRGIEKFSSIRCLGAITKSDVVVLLIDSQTGITNQDCHIAQKVLENKKGLILAVNKTDLIESEEEKDRMLMRLKRKFEFVPWAPVVLISAKDKENIFEIFSLTEKILIEQNKRISTNELNSFLQKITRKHLPASAKFKKPKFLYATQVETSPPKFVLFFKHPENLHFSYPRYLENEIRKEYGFIGTAINLKFKGKVAVKQS